MRISPGDEASCNGRLVQDGVTVVGLGNILELTLTAEERNLAELGAAAENRASVGVASPHRIGLRGGEKQHRRG
jgi:hypothetical protein